MLLQVVQKRVDPDVKIEHKPNTEDDQHKRKADISPDKQLSG